VDKKRTTKKKSIQSMALRVGATVISEDGQQFNAAKEKVSTKRTVKAKPTPPAKPEPSPEPAATIIDQKEVAAAINNASTSMAEALADLKVQIANIQITSAQPPTEWVFDIIRDDHANLKQIVAKAITTRLDS